MFENGGERVAVYLKLNPPLVPARQGPHTVCGVELRKCGGFWCQTDVKFDRYFTTETLTETNMIRHEVNVDYVSKTVCAAIAMMIAVLYSEGISLQRYFLAQICSRRILVMMVYLQAKQSVTTTVVVVLITCATPYASLCCTTAVIYNGSVRAIVTNIPAAVY